MLLGQYVAANGKPGYLDDDTVPNNSVCPTFAALTLWINNPRWEGVPFILKAGKGGVNGRTLGCVLKRFASIERSQSGGPNPVSRCHSGYL